MYIYIYIYIHTYTHTYIFVKHLLLIVAARSARPRAPLRAAMATQRPLSTLSCYIMVYAIL